MPRASHATPTPPSQVLGGVVQVARVDGHSAAQYMYPAMPFEVPRPAGRTLATKLANLRVAFFELLKVVHSAFLPSSHRAPVIFAGALGGMGGLNSSMPLTCSTQLQTSLGCPLPGTMALA